MNGGAENNEEVSADAVLSKQRLIWRRKERLLSLGLWGVLMQSGWRESRLQETALQEGERMGHTSNRHW